MGERETRERDVKGEQYDNDKSVEQARWDHDRFEAPQTRLDDPFGAGTGKKEAVDGKTAGEGGFGARLLGGSSRAAQEHAHAIAVPVQPVMGALDKGYAEQQAFLAKTHANTGGFTMIGADPVWLAREKEYGRTWAGENMTSINRYKLEQTRWVHAYNDWVPVANASNMAKTELVEAARLMGYDASKGTDIAAFVKGLEASLEMAMIVADSKVIGAKKNQSWSSYKDDVTAPTQPNLDGEPLGPKLVSVVQAYRELQGAHSGVYQSLLKDQQKALAARKGEVTGQIQQINNTIAFWVGLGGSVGSTAKHAKSFATGKMGAAANQVANHVPGGFTANDGSRDGKRALRDAQDHAYKSSQDPQDYQHDLQAHARADDYETYHDTWGGAAPAPEMGVPDLSLQGILKAGVGLLMNDKLDELRNRLDDINSEDNALEGTIDFNATKTALNSYGSAKAKMAEEMKKVEHDSLQDRQQEMVKLGHELDSYAVDHKSDLQHHHAAAVVPTVGHEIYGTALACVAKVEQYRIISQLALDMFPFNEYIASIRAMQAERSGSVPAEESKSRSSHDTMFAPPDLPRVSAAEQTLYETIAGTYLVALDADAHWTTGLAGVEERFRALMKKMTGQDQVTGTVPKGF